MARADLQDGRLTCRLRLGLDTSSTDPSRDADLVLQQPAALQYIRFIGGGPEAGLQEGRSVGTLMGRLALAGYNGALILVPSSTRYRVAWESWLGHRGGSNCGSKVAEADLVRLPVTQETGGKR